MFSGNAPNPRTQQRREQRAIDRLNAAAQKRKAAAESGYQGRGRPRNGEIAPNVRGVKKRTRTHFGPHSEDKSPQWVRDLRLALTDKFIKTGELDTEITAKLKDYANACRKTSGVDHASDAPALGRQSAGGSIRSHSHFTGARTRQDEFRGADEGRPET